jgi:exonuclease VII small subunit
MDNEQFQVLVLEQLKMLTQSVKELEQGQNTLVQSVSAVEEGQKSLVQSVSAVEEGQKSLVQSVSAVEEDQKSLVQSVSALRTFSTTAVKWYAVSVLWLWLKTLKLCKIIIMCKYITK